MNCNRISLFIGFSTPWIRKWSQMIFRHRLNFLCQAVLSLQLTVVWLKFPMKTRASSPCEAASRWLWKVASMFVLSRQPIADTQCHADHTYLFFNPHLWTLGHACPGRALCTLALLSHKEKLSCLTFPDCPSNSLHLATAALVTGESRHHFCNITQTSSSSCLSSRLHVLTCKLLREIPQLLISIKVSEASPWWCLAGTSLLTWRDLRWLDLCLVFIMCSQSLAPS